MDKSLIKKEAWNLTKEKFGQIWKALIIDLLISSIYVIVFNYLLKENTNGYVQAGAFIYNIVTIPFAYGLSKYLLNVTRNKEALLNDLFYYYKNNILEVVVQSMIMSLLYSIGLAFYLFPAIIIFLFLAMAQNCLVDGTVNPIDALSKSCNLMKGYKWDYFNFLISFLLWFFLGIMTMGLAFIWVLPYFMISQKIYYLKLVELKEEKKPKRKSKSKKTEEKTKGKSKKKENLTK